MEAFITTVLSVFVVYGGSYAAALATASSFFAVFFFFWTRTGERKNAVDMGTKKIYLPVIYATLRISLYVMIITYIAQIGLVRYFAGSNGVDISVFDILTSAAGFFPGLVLLVLVINSTLMIFRKIPFWFALPLAIVSYFVLFVAQQFITSNLGLQGYLIPAFPGVWIALGLYLATFILGLTVFNHFSQIVRNNLKK